MFGYLSAGTIRSEKRTIFRERGLKKTVSLEKQILSKDKYRSILELLCLLSFKSFSQHAKFWPGNIQSRDTFGLINRAKIFDGMYNSIQSQVLFHQTI